MPKIISLPDGREAEFPDEMDNAAIESVLQKQFPVAGDAKQGNGQASASPAIPEQPADLEQILGPSDFTKAFASTPFRIFKSAMQMAGAGERVPAIVNELAAEGDKSLPGRIAGDVAGTGGIRAGAGRLAQSLQALNGAKGVLPAVGRTAEAATYGSAQGALTTPDDQMNAAKMGAAGGAAGQVIGRVASGIVRPTAEARTLMDAGVTLTPGQAAGKGSATKWVEEQAGNLPVASHFIRAAQGRAVEDANVAAAQSVARLVDDKIKLGKPPAEAIEQTREAVSRAYQQGLEGMSAPGAITQAHLGLRLQSLPNDFPMVPETELRNMWRFVDERLGNMGANNGGMLTGNMLKQIDSELGSHVRNLYSSANAADKTAAPAWRQVQMALREVMEMSQPDKARLEQLQAANRAYRELLALERALLPGADRFTPRQLARQLDKANIGDSSELRTIGNAMTKTLPNVVPNSGTAERLLASSLPALLMGGGAGAQGMGFDTLGAGMMAAGALGSRPGARFLTGGYNSQQALAEALRRAAPTTLRNITRKNSNE